MTDRGIERRTVLWDERSAGPNDFGAVRPRPEARYIVFHASMQPEYDPQHYFEAFDLRDMDDPQTILTYAMNGQSLPLEHGAPCRLRIETKLGYKMVKYLSRIELVASLDDVGEGRGGLREDGQYYNRMASI
ncbi:MAG TPA: molybdopterin-dependent oxidoreductase [Nitrospiraceae bacterium]|nr:molybdopterin-dependent oxidoreductase [Nitrospiraceae bacterium]